MADTTIIVLGASGDLAFKKTYPALFDLMRNSLLSPNTQIIGFARSHIEIEAFKRRISSKFKNAIEKDQSRFLGMCSYVSGNYDDAAAFERLAELVANGEQKNFKTTRIFYMALPPSVFIAASTNLKHHLYSSNAICRLVVEKPFGRDSESSAVLSSALAKHWHESEIYRIDHYLGKEMVKNLMVLRFANAVFASVWDNKSIASVQITFKERIGTEGRGGYFDSFGILRDNHLMQILTLVAMEQPASLDAEAIRDEKVKVLLNIAPLTLDDVLVGQYDASADGATPGYLDDQGVPADSTTPTYAAAVFRISNPRWHGVPFILKCGKALNEQKAEIRIQFKDVTGNIYGDSVARNELVIRVQPEEAVYMKFTNKTPGHSTETTTTELDLSYTKRYTDIRIPDAYESLLLEVLKGDKSNFVRADELNLAWAIFTPLLNTLEKEKTAPERYVCGTRGPAGVSAFVEKNGYKRTDEYVWQN